MEKTRQRPGEKAGKGKESKQAQAPTHPTLRAEAISSGEVEVDTKSTGGGEQALDNAGSRVL